MPNQRRAERLPDGTCTRCGEHHDRCAAHNRAGKPCGRRPTPGCDVCRLHGGSAPQTRAAGMRRLAQDRLAREAQATLDLVPVPDLGDPLEHFQRVLAEIEAFKQFLADRVAELGTDLTGQSHEGYEYLRAVVAAYERALDRSAKFIGLMIRLGIEERLARVREDQVRMLEQALLGALTDLGQRPEDEEVRAALGRHLRLVDGAAGA